MLPSNPTAKLEKLGENMDVSENGGFSPPNHPCLIGFSIINHPLGYPYFWKHPNVW